MSQKNSPRGQQLEKKEHSLKGTFISVMLLGVFLIVSWAGVYALFLSR